MSVALIGIGLVAFLAFADMAYWWWGTRGAWIKWPAGRSVMALLGMICIITSLAFSSIWIGSDYPGRPILYAVLYFAMSFVLIWIGATIRSELKRSGPIGKLSPKKIHIKE